MPTLLAALHQTLKLLADPTRLRLAALLAEEELSVQELMSATGLAQSRVSNHLSLLKRAGLVRDRREGTWSFHRLVEPAPDGALSPQLYEAVLVPYLESQSGKSDRAALEMLRERRRERSRRTHDRLAPEWAARGQEFRSGALRMHALAALLPRGLRLADLGCGAGYLTSFLVARGARVIAVDHSAAMLAQARRRVPQGAEFRQGEFDQLPLADGEVDGAFANLVWHHLADQDRAARELLRVVRPGGSVVITDLLPHGEEWLRERMGDLRLGVRPQIVVGALARAGFTDLVTEDVDDAYRVESPQGQPTELAMFLARGMRPAAAAPAPVPERAARAPRTSKTASRSRSKTREPRP